MLCSVLPIGHETADTYRCPSLWTARELTSCVFWERAGSGAPFGGDTKDQVKADSDLWGFSCVICEKYCMSPGLKDFIGFIYSKATEKNCH